MSTDENETVLPIYGDCPYPIWWSTIESIPTIILSIFLCQTIFVLYRILQNRSNEKVSKCSISLIIILTTTSLLTFLTHMSYHATLIICTQNLSTVKSIATVLYVPSYIIQFYTLLLLFYSKTDYIFLGTSFELASCTRTSYKAIFIIISVAVIFSWMLRYFDSPHARVISIVMIMIGMFAILLLMISIIILTVKKLMHVYRETFKYFNKEYMDEDNDPTVAAITKLTILSSLSITLTVISISVASYRLTADRNNVYLWCFGTAVSILDIYANFISGIMCYKTFDIYYKTICRCVDFRCRRCWMTIINKKDQDVVRDDDPTKPPKRISLAESAVTSNSVITTEI